VHPGIDLRVSATMHHVDFTREDVDVAVWHGDGNWGGLDAVRLCSEQLFPICSPKLLSGCNGRLARPFDMGFEIIQDLSDRLPECKFKHSEDRNLSEMAAGRGGPRYAPSQKDVCRNTITMNASSMDLFCLAVSRGNLIST